MAAIAAFDQAGLAIPETTSLSPLEAAWAAGFLVMNQKDLNTPASTDHTAVYFTVNPGETARDVATNLSEHGLITSEQVFIRYLQFYGLDVQLETGIFALTRTMPIPDIAGTLTGSNQVELVLTITEGWRREQIAAWLDTQTDLPFTGQDFLNATQGPARWYGQHTIVNTIPESATLEGYLFPDTYFISMDANADDLVTKMLERLSVQLDGELSQGYSGSFSSLYDILTVASIVEREAVVAEERAVIASVYLNRLQIGMNLEADPTVQYAMGFQPATGQWWNLDLTANDYYSVISPYNTYLNPGLPPGPIASPGFDAIRAVLQPEDTPYLYFRTTCDGSGRHNFAITYEEHLANACP
nr:endolytic transglycosylase MltG [Anaerolineae bacterium]